MKSFEDISKDAGKALWRRATKSHDPWGLEAGKTRTPTKKQGGIWHNGTFLGTREQAEKLPMKELVKQGIVKQAKKPFKPQHMAGLSDNYRNCPTCSHLISADGQVGIGKGHFNIVTNKWGGKCRTCKGKGVV